MRLYPPVWVLARNTTQDISIADYEIPKDTMILMSPYVMHHDSNFWENPEGFDPNRFLEFDQTGQSGVHYFPFGGGSRLCLGMHFAMMEVPLILSMIMNKYKCSLVPWYSDDMYPSITLAPKNGMLMLLKSRL